MITTDRLILRPYSWEDKEALYEMLSDGTTMSFWPAPFTREQADQWMARHTAHHAQHGFGRMAVVARSGGRLIGDCGLARTEVNGREEVDLGYIIYAPEWNNGYGLEAAKACLQDGMSRLKLNRIVANMPAHHTASRKVAEKLGMKQEEQFYNTRNRGILTCLYAWEASR
ncbi:GNAT family N-acetyltransferase [Paenibacillus sp. y28]|uniref:GNAT family N-acetyltransferase n=1 Tax=Paenibacillus sp. y28 TaxID=3129110 RepID=UPI003016825B